MLSASMYGKSFLKDLKPSSDNTHEYRITSVILHNTVLVFRYSQYVVLF